MPKSAINVYRLGIDYSALAYSTEFVPGYKIVDESGDWLVSSSELGERKTSLVIIKADPGNSEWVMITDDPSNAQTDNAYPLEPGEAVGIPVSDASKIYVFARSGEQRIYYMLFLRP